MVRIGITSSVRAGEDPYALQSRANYGNAVKRAGGEPVYVLNDLELLDHLIAECDGWILSGGNDVDPALYGGNREAPGIDEFDPGRDAFEMELIPRLMQERVPTLYVCRGIQVLNVALGGSLIEDLPSEMGERYRITHAQHRITPPIPRDRVLEDHVVTVDAASRLRDVLGTSRLTTNSLHHQALREVAPSLRVVARTSDGVIEGIDGPEGQPFCIGVQWHPEARDDAANSRLFEGLVAAAERRRTAVTL